MFGKKYLDSGLPTGNPHIVLILSTYATCILKKEKGPEMTEIQIDWTYRYHLGHPLRVRMDRWRAMRRLWWLERGRGRSYGQVLRKRKLTVFSIVYGISYVLIGIGSKLAGIRYDLIWVGVVGLALFPVAVALRLKIDYDDGDIMLSIRRALEGLYFVYDYYLLHKLLGQPYRPRYSDIDGRLSLNKRPEWVLCPGPHFRVRGRCWLRNGWSDVSWVKQIHMNNMHMSQNSFIEHGSNWARPVIIEPGEVVGPGRTAA
jgi:hypothetical protein